MLFSRPEPYIYILFSKLDLDHIHSLQGRHQDKTMNTSSDSFFQRCVLFESTYQALVKIPSKAYLHKMISACTFQMLLIIPTILLNGISVITIMKCPQLKEKIAYFLIMTQSIADLAVGFISLPLMSYVCMTQILGNADCLTQRIILVIASFSFFMSPTALIAMSVDRYLSVVYPLKHRVMVTKKKITHFLAYGNLFMLAFTGVSVLKVKVLDAFHSTYLLLFIILAIFVYTKIFITIRNKKRPGNVAENTTQNRENQRKFLKEVKLVKSCFLAVACSFFAI